MTRLLSAQALVISLALCLCEQSHAEETYSEVGKYLAGMASTGRAIKKDTVNRALGWLEQTLVKIQRKQSKFARKSTKVLPINFLTK